MESTNVQASVPTREPAAGPRRPGPANPYLPFPEAEVEQSVPARFEQQARRHPGRLAVKTLRHELTYEALDRAANRLAHAILARRGPGVEPVAFLTASGAPQIVALLGILKAGKIYAALDAAFFPPARLAYLLEDTQAGLLVTDSAHLALAQQLSGGSRPLVNLDALDDGLPGDTPGLALAAERPALLLYTSGSTGQPKGVLHSHRNVLHYTRVLTNSLHLRAEDRLSLMGSCSFAGSVTRIFPALLNGAALLPFGLPGQTLASLARWVVEEEITLLAAVPSAFRHLAGTLTGAESFPRVRVVGLGGEAVTRRDIELFRKHFGPDCLLSVGLGASEVITVTGHFLDRETPLPEVWAPLGQESEGSQVLLLDEAGREVGPGEVGEIAVRSRYLALGYWRDPGMTAAAFRPAGDEEGVRVYRTGDLGLRRPDGCLEYRGRKDFQVKVRGYRIDVAEVETALLELPAVKEAVVVGREDGSGGRRLAAYVVPAGNAAPVVSDLRKALRERLPAYMVPSAFVVLDALPLNCNRKVDRQALPAPDTERPALANPFAPPDGPLEQLLAEVWEDWLAVRPVGALDPFFELGGDSLLAVGMLGEVERRLDRKVHPDALLGSATVRELAAALGRPAEGPAEVQGGDPARRLFFLHGDFGGGFYCRKLAKLLGPGQPLVVLHPHGLTEAQVPQTVEEMAADRLRLLLEVQPEGPYRLGGYCNGGVVAFEMARQLWERGARVELLVVIAPPPFIRLAGTPAADSPRPPSYRFDLGALVLPQASASAPRAPAVDVSGLTGQQLFDALLRAYTAPLQSYRLQRYPGRLVLIQPRGDVDSFGDAEPLWRAAAPQLESHTIPGTHEDCVRGEPAALAGSLRACLGGAP